MIDRSENPPFVGAKLDVEKALEVLMQLTGIDGAVLIWYYNSNGPLDPMVVSSRSNGEGESDEFVDTVGRSAAAVLARMVAAGRKRGGLR